MREENWDDGICDKNRDEDGDNIQKVIVVVDRTETMTMCRLIGGCSLDEGNSLLAMVFRQ